MGCVLPAGLGQAPARQAAHRRRAAAARCRASPSTRCAARASRRWCSAAQRDRAPATPRSWSPAAWSRCRTRPTCCPRRATGMRMGHGQLVDSMVHDGLWDAYGNVHMGDCAELCAREKRHLARGAGRLRRRELPPRARRRRPRASSPPRSSPVEVPAGKGPPMVVDADEEPGRGNLEKLPRCARVPEGRHRHRRQRVVAQRRRRGAGAGRAPRRREKRGRAAAGAHRGVRPTTRRRPSGSPPRPAGAIERAASKAAGSQADVDLWEINEAFAVVSLANNQTARPRPGPGQRLGRRGRARPPDRRRGRARAGHAAARAGRRGQASRRAPRCASAAARASRCWWSGCMTRRVEHASAWSAPARWGAGIAQVAAQAGLEVVLRRRHAARWPRRARAGIGGAARPAGREGQARRPPSATRSSRASAPARGIADLGDVRLRGRGGARERGAQAAASSPTSIEACRPGAILASNTSSISITTLRRAHRPARARDRHALHEPGAGDEAGRDRPRAGHLRRDLRRPPAALAEQLRQDHGGRRATSPASSSTAC